MSSLRANQIQKEFDSVRTRRPGHATGIAVATHGNTIPYPLNGIGEIVATQRKGVQQPIFLPSEYPPLWIKQSYPGYVDQAAGHQMMRNTHLISLSVIPDHPLYEYWGRAAGRAGLCSLAICQIASGRFMS